MQTIFPILRYDDARAAIRGLCVTFGFVELFSVPEDGAFVRHAQLRLGTNIVMLGSTRLDESMASPRKAGGTTQALYVFVDDVEAHFKRARSAGAEITSPLQDTDFGSREYHVLDLEGHHWAFGSYSPETPRAKEFREMVSTPTEEQLMETLSAAASAHHDYESNVLGGARDEQWAGWYAAYVLGRLGEFTTPTLLTRWLKETTGESDWSKNAAAHVLEESSS